MNNSIRRNLKKWYVWVICLMILIYSLLCWYKLLLNGKSAKYDDSLAKKSIISNLDTILSYYLTHDISSTQVVLGKRKWLFYLTSEDGDSIADYEGLNCYTNDEMHDTLDKVIRVQNLFQKKDIKFAILIPPNKENVYYEYMSDEYTKAEKNRTNNLSEYLSKNGVNIVYPIEEMVNNTSVEDLFYHYDSHWNQLGAYVGVKAVLKLWDMDIPELAERDIKSKKLEYHMGAEDDLAGMTGLKKNICDDEIDYEINNHLQIDWNSFNMNEETVLSFYNDNSLQEDRLLLIGDSFRTAMIPELRELYRYVFVVHRGDFNEGMIEVTEPDYVLFEYVERYSDDICRIGYYFE